ncbi:MAG: phage major capsid protein [Rhodomicrobium sp.]
MGIPNSTYTQALTASIANYRDKLADSVTANNAFLTYLKKNGNSDPFDGGTEILENIVYNTATGGWYSGSQILSTADSDVLTSANFAIKQFYANVTMNGLEIIQNSGKERMFKLIDGKLKGAEAQLSNSIGASLFFSNTENSGLSIGGLQFLIADSPTSSSTIGGIDQSLQTWWRNYSFSFSSNSLTAGSSTVLTALNTSFMNTVRGTEKIDLVLGGLTYFGYFEGALQANQRFLDADLAKAGFDAYRYKSAMVMFDPNCSATRMYGINSKYFFFRPHPTRNFTQGDRKESVNQDVYVVPIYWAGNLTMSNRARQFVLIA